MTKFTKSAIEVATDLGSYFKEEVTRTAQKQGLQLAPQTSEYLARVLERFSNTQALLLKNKQKIENAELTLSEPTSPTLASLWLESFHMNLSEQFFHLQNLGDFALFTSGYFSDYVRKSMVDQDYYFAIGGQAYQRAGKIRETISAEKELNTFFELAQKFKHLAEVFEELSDKTLLTDDKSTLKLYEKWLTLKSERIKRMLAEKGIIAADNPRGHGSFD